MGPDREGADSREDLLALVDELLEEVGEIKRQWSDVASSLGAAPEPAGREERSTPRRGDTGDPRRLVAVEMMIAGHSRAEVEAHLRATYGDEAAQSLIAGVYGEGDGR